MKYKGISLSLDKREEKNTISHQFKKDFIDLFEDDKWKKEGSILEVSCFKGYTTNVLSNLFEKVYAVDIQGGWLKTAKEYNKDKSNIEYFSTNVYNATGWDSLPEVDVIFIDCEHTYGSVKSDIKNAVKHIKGNSGLIILDDYGRYGVVRDAVNDTLTKNKQLTFLKWMGEPEGSDCRPGKVLSDWEGVVLSYEKDI